MTDRRRSLLWGSYGLLSGLALFLLVLRFGSCGPDPVSEPAAEAEARAREAEAARRADSAEAAARAVPVDSLVREADAALARVSRLLSETSRELDALRELERARAARRTPDERAAAADSLFRARTGGPDSPADRPPEPGAGRPRARAPGTPEARAPG
jgi:hypothetical protein